MKKLVIGLLAIAAVAAVVVLPASEPQMQPSTMISRLKVGQTVRTLTGSTGGTSGFNIEIPSDQSIKNYQRQNKGRKYPASKITEIGSDSIVVTSANGTVKTIAIHAIDVITKLPEVKVEADDEPKK